jgi:hypothetical protein
MRRFLAFHVATILSFSIDSMAATVGYKPPDLTIVAKGEPLQSVLRTVGKEMQIFVTMPTGVNPTVSCDIQNLPIKMAFETLLEDMSYSLEWEEKSGRLVGLTILAGYGDTAVATASKNNPSTPSLDRAAPAPVVSTSDRVSAARHDYDNPVADHDAQRAEHESRMEVDREEREASMAEEREAHEAQMAVRRREEEIVLEARMREDIARKKEEEAVLFAEEATRRP